MNQKVSLKQVARYAEVLWGTQAALDFTITITGWSLRESTIFLNYDKTLWVPLKDVIKLWFLLLSHSKVRMQDLLFTCLLWDVSQTNEYLSKNFPEIPWGP